ncbi:MAG: omptin family outer membrane protease [Treponema sp.]|jgi:outer membrane protease|nr:omptin family outer membrane protease [Treponema sp.]
MVKLCAIFRKPVHPVAFLLSVFLIVSFPVHGEESSHVFSLGTETGFLYGTSYEISYNGTGSSQYISELQWHNAPLLFAGLSMEYAPRYPLEESGFFGKLAVKAGLPVTTGTIEDRDWLIPGVLTHYSSHDNRTRAALFVDLGGGFSLPLLDKLFLRLHFGLSYMYFDQEARDGYTQYDPANTYPYIPWNPAWPKVKHQGPGIGYAQHWFIIRPGLEFVYRVNRFSFSASVFAFPMVFAATADNHYKRDPPFLVETDLGGGWFFEPKGSVLFALNTHCTIGVTASYRYIDGARGDVILHEYYSYGTAASKGIDLMGAAYRAFEGALTFSYTF